MKYWRIFYGFREDDYISISEEELPKAIALFMEANGRGIFRDGMVRGQDIRIILPDWHKAEGWNKGWKMTPDDYADIEALKDGYDQIYLQAKTIVEIGIRENRRDLITKPLSETISILEDRKPKKLQNEIKELSDKFKIK